MRVTMTLAALTVAIALGGCGSDPQGQVRSKVRQFADAVAARDYGTICGDVLAPSLLADFARGGISCPQALRISLGRVRNPRLTIGPVTIRGRRASVLTISQARAERTVLGALQLVETRSGWRIDSLGSPLP